MPLDKAAILAAKDLRTEAVPVPEWGGEVLVRAISAAEREELAELQAKARVNGAEQPKHATAICVAFAVVKEDGSRVFANEDVGALSRKSARVLDRIVDAFNRVNGLGQEQETLLKNSAAGRNVASPSA